jgi:hypothetical protein
MAMMAMTTNNSIRVNPLGQELPKEAGFTVFIVWFSTDFILRAVKQAQRISLNNYPPLPRPPMNE